jgi:hypothetical protein
MANQILSKVEAKLEQYKREHHGDDPLYIFVPSDDVTILTEDVRGLRGYSNEVPVTSYKGIKIVANDILQPGQIILSDDLPETGS